MSATGLIAPHRTVLASLMVLAASGTLAFGQSQSLFGSRGPISSLSGSGTSGFGGTSSVGAANLGAGVTGPAGTSGLGGTGGLGQTSGVPQLGELSQTIGQGFVGRSDNLGRFVGNAQAGQQGQLGTTGNRFGAGGLGARGNNLNGQSLNARQGLGGAGATRQRVVRPRQRIAFDYPQRSRSAIQQSVRTRISGLSRRAPEVAGVEVTVDGEGVATLRGTVESEDARRLAAAMLRLEPGIRSVENQLTVAGQ